MDKWIKKLSGAVIASVLALTLSSKAYADPTEEPVPDLPVPQYEEKAADTVDPNSSDRSSIQANDGPVTPETGSETALNSENQSFNGETEGSAADTIAPEIENTSTVPLRSAENDIITTSLALTSSAENELLISGDENNVTDSNTDAGDNVLVQAQSVSLTSGNNEDGSPDKSSSEAETGLADQPRSSSGNSENESGTISIAGHDIIPGQSGSFCDDQSIAPVDDHDTGTTILLGFDAGKNPDASDDSLYMVNYDGSSQSLISTNSDINITAGGLNRIGSIQADGNVNLTGTGILLVDSVTLSEGKGFFLKPITEIYGANGGSVAVFLRRAGSGADASNAVYDLVNGSVPGILDESYVIPEGIDLVMPSGSVMELKSMVVAEDHETEALTYFFDEVPYGYYSNQAGDLSENYDVSNNVSSLTVSAGSSLTIEDGASLIMSKVDMKFESSQSTLLTPELVINGNLTVNGDIKGAGTITFGNADTSPAILNGTGTIQAESFSSVFSSKIADESALLLDCPKIDFYDCNNEGFQKISGIRNFNVKNSIVIFRLPVTIENFTSQGDCRLIANNQQLGNISVSDGGTLSLHGFGFESPLSISGKVSGGLIRFLSGSYVFSETSSVSPGTVFSYSEEQDKNCESFIYNYSGADLASFFSVQPAGVPRILSPTLPAQIPDQLAYSFMFLHEQPKLNPDGHSDRDYMLSSHIVSGNSSGLFTESSGTTVFSFNDLLGILNNTLDESLDHESLDQHFKVEFAVHYISTDGKLYTRFVTKEKPSLTLPAGSIPVAVDGFYIKASSLVYPVNPITSTLTSSTGSGILGGGSGSITGGTGSLIFGGSSSTDPVDPPSDPSDPGNGSQNSGGNADTPALNISPVNAQNDIVITVTPQDESAGSQDSTFEVSVPQLFTLSVSVDGQPVTALDEVITVRFTCPAPATGKQIFVVFRDDDGSLKAIKARYDKITGQLIFETDMLGDFAVVCIDFDGELYSAEFYELIESLVSAAGLK